MKKSKGRRPRVGIIVGSYHTDHPIHLVHTVWKLLQEKGVDAQFYLGTESSSFLGQSLIQENYFDYQYASLYGYSHFDDLDALIVSSGTLFIYRQGISLKDFLITLPHVPVVLLEADLPVADGCSIITDNSDSIRELVEHLILVHSKTKIGFVAGTVGNWDADYRLQAFLEAMEAHGLPVAPSQIQYGDFSEHTHREVSKLLDDNPGLEAIVCANDEMAMAAYSVCQERGLVIGKDILITGFDDIRLAEYMNPTLTTCCQDYKMISRHAVDRVMDILEGRKVESEVVPSPVIYRDSCGCSNPHSNDEATRTRERKDLIQSIWDKHDEQIQPWIGALLYREMLTDTMDLKMFFDHLGKSLADLGTEESYITLLPETLRLPLQNVVPPSPERLKLMMVQRKDSWTAYSTEEAPVWMPCTPTERMGEDGWVEPAADEHRGSIDNVHAAAASHAGGLNDGIDPERYEPQGLFMTFLLFFEDYQYGAWHVKIPPRQISFYYTLSLEIGSALRFFQVSRSHMLARKNLRDSNERLDYMASHDELTGLYNRAGIIQKLIDAISQNRDTAMAVVMVDQDHLKEINDTFGHPEGDHAIQAAARLLQKCLGRDFPIGRLGGDEFIGLIRLDGSSEMSEGMSPSSSANWTWELGKRLEVIQRACEEYNETSGKPYLLELSLGTAIVTPEENFEFFKTYHEADRSLYEAKKHRRTSVVKSSGFK